MFEKIIEKLNNAECVGIFTHINPDGDALGSSYSLKNILKDMGKRAEVYLCGSIEPCVFELVKADNIPEFPVEQCDMLIALDSADIDRLGEWSEVFAKHGNTAAIDHHITHKHYANETVVGDISSNCELMYSLYKEMGITLSIEAASDLYIGISTDTGNFKFESVTGNTHRVAAELIEAGVPFSDIAKRIFGTVTKEYLKLQSRAIDALEFYLDGRMAVLSLSDKDFEECGIDEASASSIVSLPGSIEGVEVGVYIRQRTETEYKVSLRSVRCVDVAEIASGFGGGGHIRAAGYSITKDEIEKNIKELMGEIERQL